MHYFIINTVKFWEHHEEISTNLKHNRKSERGLQVLESAGTFLSTGSVFAASCKSGERADKAPWGFLL